MADTDNKDVGVQTLSVPKPPQAPKAAESAKPPQAPDTAPPADAPSPGEPPLPASGTEAPVVPAPAQPVDAPAPAQQADAPALPAETAQPDIPTAAPETEKTISSPESPPVTAAPVLRKLGALQSTQQADEAPKAAQSSDAPTTEQPAVEQPAPAPDTKHLADTPETEQPAETPKEPETEEPESEEPDKDLAARLKNMERQIRRTVTKARRVTQHGSERAKATAGPALSKTAAELRKGGKRGGLALGSFYRERLKPYLAQRRANLAARLTSQALTRDYRRLLLRMHRYGPDRSIEQHCFVSTAEHIPLSIVRVPHQLRRSGHDYRPTPRLVFQWAMELLPDPVERHEFIDYGAGRGRVLLMASNHPFEKITGAEIAEELANDCRLNIAQYPRSLMKCRDVNCEHLSALRLPVPDQETVFFFNNPFAKSMFERVITQIVRSYKQEPRPLFVICVDINADEIMEDTGVFTRIQPSMAQKLKIKTFSPYSISVYRTIYEAPTDDDGDERVEEAKDADAGD